MIPSNPAFTGGLELYSRTGLQHALAAIGGKPIHSLGQNFLIDYEVVSQLLEIACPEPNEAIIEPGPGLGQVTAGLVASEARVTAVEYDRLYVQFLERRFQGAANLSILHDDGIRFLHRLHAAPEQPPQRFRIVSDLPFNISSPLMVAAMTLGERLPQMILTLQLEVAERLAAAAGTTSCGVLSILLEVQHRVVVERVLDPKSFWPRPKVTPAIVSVTRLPSPKLSIDDPKLFSHIVRHCFQQRRKMLRNSLVGAPPLPCDSTQAAGALQRAGISPMARPEQLSVAEFAALSVELKKILVTREERP